MYIYKLIKSFLRKKKKKKKTGYQNCMKGKFKCLHPEKYKGDPTNIIYRSSWEMVMMSRLDKDPNIIWWQSEEFFVPYRSPVDNKIHRYFVDFKCKIKDIKGNHQTILIEVKPKKQTVVPKRPPKINKSFIKEAVTYSVNRAKWDAAHNYCLNNGYKFIIMTEDDIFGKFTSKEIWQL